MGKKNKKSKVVHANVEWRVGGNRPAGLILIKTISETEDKTTETIHELTPDKAEVIAVQLLNSVLDIRNGLQIHHSSEAEAERAPEDSD